MVKPRVLFICLGNSCRSIMAEALTRHLCGERWEAASAGLNSLGWVATETITVLAEMGVGTAGLHSKGLTEIDLQDYCLIVNLSDYSLHGVLPPATADRVIQRPIPDPFGGSLDGYRRSRDAIKHMIEQEICREDVPLRCQNRN